MYSENGKVGVIIPSANTITEPEFNRHLPDGVTAHVNRMTLSGPYHESDIERSLSLLADAGVDLIAYGCTMSSIEHGPTQLEEDLSRRADIPTITTAASILRALDHLDIESLAVATPYPDDHNEVEREFLEGAGYDVRIIDGIGATGGTAGQFGADEVYEFASGVYRDDVDGMLISCMNFRTMDVIPRLERSLGCPVVSSNQATLWDALRRLDVDAGPSAVGSLMGATRTASRPTG